MPSVLGTLLANIPWGQVVESAPKIAQGAGRLWETVKNRRAEPPPEPDPAAQAPSELAQLQARAAALEAQVQALHEEMRASAQLVKELAEQNALLVDQLQAMQQRQSRLARLAGAGLAVLAGALVWLAWWR